MSLPDGEYDIDLAGLIDRPSCSNVALRYSFLPDSFDATKPLTMYEEGTQIVVDGNGTLFEGLGSKRSGTTDYYLTIHHSGHAELKQLHNTIRVNKTRQADKLRSQIKVWEKQSAADAVEQEEKQKQRLIKEREAAKAREVEKQRRIAEEKERLAEKQRLAEQHREEERQRHLEEKRRLEKERTRAAAEKKKQDQHREHLREKRAAANTRKVSSKRPPSKEEVTSDSSSDDALPPKKSAKTEAEPMDLDDEFKDLEDQLAEVLEETPSTSNASNQPRISLEESDESDFDEVPFGGITIDTPTAKQSRTTAKWGQTTPRASKKPVSLKDFVGDDEISEEE
ncbi:hypothetical protein DICA0_F27182 [Diutina catenulata]